jgi:hypothetical protein
VDVEERTKLEPAQESVEQAEELVESPDLELVQEMAASMY